MADLSLSEYEKLSSPRDEGDRVKVSEKNIKRALRVRSIDRNKADFEKEYFGLHDLQKFKKLKEEIMKTNSLLVRIGTHPFMNKKHKQRTMAKFKNVNGLNFGATERFTYLSP